MDEKNGNNNFKYYPLILIVTLVILILGVTFDRSLRVMVIVLGGPFLLFLVFKLLGDKYDFPAEFGCILIFFLGVIGFIIYLAYFF